MENNIMKKYSSIMHLLILALLFSPSIDSAADSPPFYPDKLNLLQYQDNSGVNHPVAKASEWEIRRAHIAANMQLVMGEIPGEEKKMPLDMRVVGEEDMGAYTRKKITFAVESGDRLPAYLLIPKNLPTPAPAMLCLHPTSEHGKGQVVGLGDKPNRNYAGELAERGYVCIAPDYPGFGEYKDINVYAMGYASATMKGIWNHMRCVDLLQSMPEVDPERIGAIGHSLGGHNALFAGFFDPRIKVMVSSCGFNRFAKYYGGDLTGWSHKGYMPRIAEVYGKDPSKMPFDWTEILAGLAPRPVFVCAPVNDANFDVSGVEDCINAASPVYALYSAADKLKTVYPKCEHDFPDEARKAAYEFIGEVLK